MKTPSLLLLGTIAFYLAGCAGDEPTSTPAARTGEHHQKVKDDQGDEPKDKQPRLGMSQRQIRQMYGDPSDIRHSSRGEVWQYWFNRGHAFIPYNFGYKPRMGTFTFNASGTLIDFDYNE